MDARFESTAGPDPTGPALDAQDVLRQRVRSRRALHALPPQSHTGRDTPLHLISPRKIQPGLPDCAIAHRASAAAAPDGAAP